MKSISEEEFPASTKNSLFGRGNSLFPAKKFPVLPAQGIRLQRTEIAARIDLKSRRIGRNAQKCAKIPC
jgi:hypothetical protein